MSPFDGVLLLADDERVAVEDAGLDHRVAADREQEVGTAPERLRHGDPVLDVLLREQRRAGRDLAEQAAAAASPRPAGAAGAVTVRWPIRSRARGFEGSRLSRPARSRFARWACTVDGEASPTASPISRTVGG